MNSNRNIIQVFEHKTLKVGDDLRFRDSHFAALEKYAYKTGEKYFQVGNRRIKFSNYVGVIQVNNLTIEILPKADLEENANSKAKWHSALIKMLHECKLIRLNSITNANLKLKSCSLLDLYLDAYISEVEQLVKQGLKKSYTLHSENSEKIKGRICFNKNIRLNLVRRDRFYIEYSKYSKNCILNQILLKALKIISGLTSNAGFHLRINRMLTEFDTITETKISQQHFDKIVFERNTERYRSAIELARLIILKYSPDLKGGNENVLAILFDMNKLFENYIYRQLKKLEFTPGISSMKVREQLRKPFWETRGIKPDILISLPDREIVIDTKWKINTENMPSDSDLKQMFVYNLYYDSELSILLYPKTNLSNSGKKPFKDIRFDSGNCQMGYVDIFDETGTISRQIGQHLYDELLAR
jgi:5-methylcytosine-specific restriction enzyme subunit McrC